MKQSFAAGARGQVENVQTPVQTLDIGTARRYSKGLESLAREGAESTDPIGYLQPCGLSKCKLGRFRACWSVSYGANRWRLCPVVSEVT